MVAFRGTHSRGREFVRNRHSAVVVVKRAAHRRLSPVGGTRTIIVQNSAAAVPTTRTHLHVIRRSSTMDPVQVEYWVFAYGSLCWNPGFEFKDSMVGYVQGFSRKFWQGNIAHRGTKEKVNLRFSYYFSPGARVYVILRVRRSVCHVFRVLSAVSRQYVNGAQPPEWLMQCVRYFHHNIVRAYPEIVLGTTAVAPSPRIPESRKYELLFPWLHVIRSRKRPRVIYASNTHETMFSRQSNGAWRSTEITKNPSSPGHSKPSRFH